MRRGLASMVGWAAAAGIGACGGGGGPSAGVPTEDGGAEASDISAATTDAGARPDAPSARETGGDAAGHQADASGLDGSARDGGGPGQDVDQDGLDDALEAQLARDYLPYLSISPADQCAVHGLLVRVSPHPSDPGRVMIWNDVLYDADCGANGHVGDDEMFGVVVDPARPAPSGILAVRAISHQGTPCQQVTDCGRCPGMTACGTAARRGQPYPVVYPSVNKHGNYAVESTCGASVLCDFGGCALSAAADEPPIVNAGEPGRPMVNDLTAQGFVTAADGWTHAALLHFDPWKPGDFGGAGDVSKDLVDPSFVVDTTACP